MQILGYDPKRHDRFYSGSDRAFGWENYDWTGVGQGYAGAVAWATLISDTYFIGANHFQAGTPIRFWKSNDPADYVDCTVASGQQVDAQADCFLGRLSSAAPAAVKRYAIGSGYAGELGLEVVGVGHGAAHSNSANQVFGRNNVDALYDQPGSGYKQEFEYVNDHAVGFSPDEFEYEGGDSGGPTFAIIAGAPVLVGEHHAVSGSTYSFDSSVSARSSDIQTLVQAGGESVTITAVAPVVPAAPTLLSAVAGSAQATLTWTEEREAATYSVYKDGVLLASGLAKSLDGTTHSYTATGLTNGVSYAFTVTGTNGAGEGAASNSLAVTPVLATPAIIVARAGNKQATLVWTASGGATGYWVYRSTASGTEVKVAQVVGVGDVDTGLTNGTTYYYKVSAVDGTGETSLSNEISVTPAVQAMTQTYQEMYCDAANGNNTYSGDTTEVSPVVATNGAYTQGGGAGGTSDLFAAASGTPFSARQVGQLFAIMNDGGTIATQISRILAINGGGASVDLGNGVTNMLGARHATAANGVTGTCGGPHKGPNGTSIFPFTLTNRATFTDANGNRIWTTLFNNATYSMTGAGGSAVAGPYGIGGATTTPRDGGRAIIDGGTSGASYTLLTFGSGVVEDVEIRNNGDTGSATLVVGTGTIFRRCSLHDSAGSLLSISASCITENCDFYAANKNNTAATPAILMSASNAGLSSERCEFHDNTGSNTNAITASTTVRNLTLHNCIFDSNGRDAIEVSATGSLILDISECDFYDNGKDAVEWSSSTTGQVLIQNSNFGRNVNDVNLSGSTNTTFTISSCGFCSGADASTAPTTGLGFAEIEGSITYTSPTNPWRDPANGDFTIVHSLAKGKGRGTFLATQAGYTGQTGYPDVGAAQHKEPGVVF